MHRTVTHVTLLEVSRPWLAKSMTLPSPPRDLRTRMLQLDCNTDSSAAGVNVRQMNTDSRTAGSCAYAADGQEQQSY
jgi:hypothetical protein